MATLTAQYAPDDVQEYVIANIPAGGLAVVARGFEIVTGPSSGVLVVRTAASGTTNRTMTVLDAGYEHTLQILRIMPAVDGTTVTLIRLWT
jgi:hypothetical protein